MKKVLIFLSVLVIVSCTSTNKMIKQGKYDDAIDKLVVKLEKKPGEIKSIRQMDSACHLANNRNNNYIRNLKLSGQPDIWHKVYNNYRQLDTRQQKVAMLPEDARVQLQFTPEDYSSFLSESREKACAYYYALAQKKLTSGNLDDHPKAFQYLLGIDSLIPEYKDVKELLAKYKKVEPVYIYFRIKNKYSNQLSPSIEMAIKNIDLSAFDQDGIKFLNEKPKQGGYQYYAEVKIYNIMISPEKTEEIFYTESADIQDGVAYEVDENGDFILDSLGNKFEMPKYKTIACYVTESIQHKSMLVAGTVEILERATGNKIAEKEIIGETKFSHRWAKFDGDLNALSAETFELVGTREFDYPSDNAMMNKATEKLGKNAAAVVADEIEKHEVIGSH